MRVIALLIIIASLAICPQAQARELTIYCEYQLPEKRAENELSPRAFMLYRVVRELMRRTDIKGPIRYASWKKGYSEATTTPDIGLFPTTRTKQRENLFHWVGPIMNVDWAFVSRADSKLEINSLDDAKKVKRLGTYERDAKEQWLQSQGFTNLVSSMDNMQNLKKLYHGRLDLMAATPSALRAWSIPMGYDFDKEFRVQYVFNTKELYLALSRGTDPETINALRKAFADMAKDGYLDRIYKIWLPNQTPPEPTL